MQIRWTFHIYLPNLMYNGVARTGLLKYKQTNKIMHFRTGALYNIIVGTVKSLNISHYERKTKIPKIPGKFPTLYNPTRNNCSSSQNHQVDGLKSRLTTGTGSQFTRSGDYLLYIRIQNRGYHKIDSGEANNKSQDIL